MSRTLRIASINVNGIRAAYRKGFGDWLAESGADIVTIQEVRAADDDVRRLVNDDWHVLSGACSIKGRAGVAVLSREPAIAHRTGLGPDAGNTTGRWLEADFDVDGTPLTVVSAYVHSGEVGTPRQDEKFLMLEAMATYLPALAEQHPLSLITGDLNVGHTTLDIKNWKANQKRSGFLPRERAYFDRFFGPAGETLELADGTTGTGLGWVDVGRRLAGDVPGPYTWWTMRGRAFDTGAGWRIDYHAATPGLADRAAAYEVDKQPSYDERWSDHAPAIAEYQF